MKMNFWPVPANSLRDELRAMLAYQGGKHRLETIRKARRWPFAGVIAPIPCEKGPIGGGGGRSLGHLRLSATADGRG